MACQLIMFPGVLLKILEKISKGTFDPVKSMLELSDWHAVLHSQCVIKSSLDKIFKNRN